jgi:hypothetical protein
MSYIPQLVSVFARHSVDDISKKPELLENAFGTPLADLKNQQGFPEERELVERMKRIVERLEQDPQFDLADKKAQVSRSLRALFRFVRYENAPASTVLLRLDTLRDLLLARYTVNNEWTPQQRAHFDFVYERLREWKTYFLSYTNEGGKIINTTFKDVVDLYTAPEVLADRDRTRDNILADAIVNSLRKRLGSRGSFFDKKDIGLAQNLDDAITPAATKTFAFVQLVHLETFDSTVGRVNWAWKEYTLFETYTEQQLRDHQEYREVFDSRFAPVLTASKAALKRQLAEIPWDYDFWYQRIFEKAKFLELPVSTASFDSTMDDLSAGIVNLTYKIIDNVP